MPTTARQVLLSSFLLAALAACGSSKHGGERIFPGPSVTEQEVLADNGELAAAEKDLAPVGFVFKVAEKQEDCLDQTAACKWTLDLKLLGQLANKPTSERKKALPFLRVYVDKAEAYLEKYSRPLGLKKENGAIPQMEVDVVLLKDIKAKMRIALGAIDRLEKMSDQPESKPAPGTSPAPAPGDTVAPDPDATTAPDPDAVTAPDPDATTAPDPDAQLVSLRLPASANLALQVSPMNVEMAGGSRTAATCAEFMAWIVSKSEFRCDVTGTAGTFTINEKAAPSEFSKKSGSSWEHNGQHGTEVEYSLKVTTYDIPLFTLRASPSGSVKVSESCSGDVLSVVTRERNRDGSLGEPETVEIRRGKTNPQALGMAIARPRLNLKLVCR